ncbi:MAG TPA: NlpC/P60 family protein [Galbitalea sp.]|jgi:cell wall-associated NlpC family hydrolase
MRRPFGALSLVVAVAALVALGTTPASADDPVFPTWAQVLAAKASASAKAAEVKKIQGIIGTLQAQAAAAGKIALQDGEVYLEAKDSLTSATETANKLSAQAKKAEVRAKKSQAQAGQLAAQLAREGHGNLSLDLFLNQHSSGSLLNVLGTMSKLGETSARIFATAEQDHKTATALSKQASVAKSIRSTKASQAKSDLDTANASSAAATAKVKAQTAQQSILTSQLASLNGTSASTEAAYYAGVAWEAKQAAQKTPPPDGTPTGPVPGAPNGSAVSVAIAYAEAQLGHPYQLGGAGPTYFDCSGLTLKAYQAAGIYIGTHSSTNQYNTLKSENRLVPLSERQPGDLLWYSDGGSTTATKYHVTIYIGNGQMIEAPYPGVPVRVAALRFGDLVAFAGRPTG